MSRFHGKMDNTGPKKGRKNKGVLKAYRERKRIEAELRNADCDPRKTKEYRLGSAYNPSTGKRDKLKRRDWDEYDIRIIAFLDREGERAHAQA